MEKIVDDPAAGSFFSAVLNTLIRCQGFSELVKPFESTCQCPAYKLALQGYQELIKLDEFLEGMDGQADLNWFLLKLLQMNHYCSEHRKVPCQEKCIFHSFFSLDANSRFSCKFGHVYETRTKEDYMPIFEIDTSKYFPKLPKLVKTTLKASDSLVCPYQNNMIFFYSSFSKLRCSTCNQESCSQSIYLNTLPKTLVFQLNKVKLLKELENLRIFASFPNSFDSSQLFSSPSTCNYCLVGYVLRKNQNFMSLFFSPLKKVWIFASAGQTTEDSHFESIVKCVIEGFFIVAVMYSENNYSYTSFNDQMWLHIENKIINRYTLGGRIPGILRKPYQNRFWTCSSCKELNFNLKQCKCLIRFTIEQLGWPCLCLKRSVEAKCECGVILTKCFGCNTNYVKAKNNQWPLRCNICESWMCVICKKSNTLFYPLCSFCSNPNINFVQSLKKLKPVYDN